MNILTRRYHETIVPFADLANTDIDANVNVDWTLDVSEKSFTWSTSTSLPAGSEVIIQYCKGCDNFQNVRFYGFYMEGNPNRGDHRLSLKAG